MNETPTSTIAPRIDLDLAWDSLHPNLSEQKFLTLLEAEGTQSAFTVEILTQVARAEMFLQKLTEADTTLTRAEVLLKDHSSSAAQIRCLIERGRLFIALKTPSRARPLFAQAWSLAVNHQLDFFTIDLALLMAEIEPIKSQEEWVLKAIEIAEESAQPNTKRYLGHLYYTLGWKYSDRHLYEKALQAFGRALEHFTPSTIREIISTKCAIGKVTRKMGKTTEALAMQQGLLVENEKNELSDGRIFEEIAECLLTLHRPAEAQVFFDKAYKELSSLDWTSDNQELRLRRIKTLGKVK